MTQDTFCVRERLRLEIAHTIFKLTIGGGHPHFCTQSRLYFTLICELPEDEKDQHPAHRVRHLHDKVEDAAPEPNPEQLLKVQAIPRDRSHQQIREVTVTHDCKVVQSEEPAMEQHHFTVKTDPLSEKEATDHNQTGDDGPDRHRPQRDGRY